MYNRACRVDYNFVKKMFEVFRLNYDAVFEDAFRTHSSSLSVGLLRLGCAILSIVSAYKTTILASDITDQ